LASRDTTSPDDTVQTYRKRLHIPPCYVARANGSTYLHGYSLGVPLLSVSRLIGLTSVVPLAIAALGRDLAGSCGRMRNGIGKQMKTHNRASLARGEGVALLIDVPCMSHIFHREIEHEYRTADLIGKLYATAFSCSLPGAYADIIKSLVAIVEEDLRLGFYPGVMPPNDEPVELHCRNLLEVTLLRAKLIMAREEDDADPKRDEREALNREIREVLNGDIRKAYCEHYCWRPGCCKGEDGTARDVRITGKRMVSIFVATIFQRIGVDLPALERWYTFAPHLSRQSTGMSFHFVLNRVVVRAFCNVTEVGQDDAENSFHANANKKKVTSVEFLSDHFSSSSVCHLACVSTFAVDHLSHRLQHLDDVGGSLIELTSTLQNSALDKCQQTLWKLQNPSTPSEFSGILPAIWWHQEVHPSADKDKFIDESRGVLTGMGAAAHARTACFRDWPLKWLGGHAREPDYQEILNQEFLGAHRCCLEELFSEPFIDKCTQGGKTLGEADMVALRTRLAVGLKATNMGLEGFLSEVRAAVPKGKRACDAEKLCYLAHLAQMMKQHVKDKRIDDRGNESRAALLAKGVPVEGSNRRSSRRSRPDRIGSAPNPKRLRCTSPREFLGPSAAGEEDKEEYDSDEKSNGDGTGANAGANAGANDSANADAWDSGCLESPLRADILVDFVHDSVDVGVGCDGLANKMHSIRARCVSSLMVHDRGDIPDNAEFSIRLSCGQAHPGLKL
jgi:hypothetical protein